MAGHGSPPPEDRANHPGRQVSRVRIEQAQTINPGPMVGTQARDIPGHYNVRKEAPSWSGSNDYLMGSIRQAKEYGGRWTGVMYGQHLGGGQVPAFNVRTEHRARVAATALAQMPAKEAVRRTTGLRESFERRFAQKRQQQG